ncbi:MAG TPA: AbrB/MazE/SpoVT family DNA-binding domain-containing protein [Candidatus Competibacter denitrificans]|jgi:bifunctional DNA-binding transcriptional regulator/antitoxin component of YhaV-PrlF toxin-antitoxin module|uniref:AbrB/MazE/SpoVT family DNA-binding domain-containing protein n=1 Tax=Candidatus Competibacter denitrificans TaxID=1400862 RepID=UPI00065F84A3|nr:AbrB/MazE/SpoVT family DNA-binding domain-containing protein [Candidatus Competibacter denitrificans]HRC68989.1 AbrB/MazE/SpoVT family DNA-binding domain-containing protein [Candidatus Competibacter denitrificans]
MRINECGQITIPQEFRERYGLIPNAEVQFVPDENGLRLVVSPASRAAAIHALYGRKHFDRSTDELLALLRE